MAYCFESRIRYSEVDVNRKLTLTALTDYFQDCSTFQSEDLGIGIDYLTERNRAWFISNWHIEILRLPLLGEKVVIETMPYCIRGIFGFRNFCMKTTDGEMLAMADSLWVYMDTKRMRPVKAEPFILESYPAEESLRMEQLSRKLPLPEKWRREEKFQVNKGHLDTNLHVNNAQYISMAQQYLRADAEVSRIRVEYKVSAVLNDVIEPLVSEEKSIVTVGLCSGEGIPYATVEFLLKG